MCHLVLDMTFFKQKWMSKVAHVSSDDLLSVYIKLTCIELNCQVIHGGNIIYFCLLEHAEMICCVKCCSSLFLKSHFNLVRQHEHVWKSTFYRG